MNFEERIQNKISKFKNKFLTKKIEHQQIASQIDQQKFSEMDSQYNKCKSLYYEQKLKNDFFPFIEEALQSFIHNYNNSQENSKYKNLLILKNAFQKIREIIETNKERMDILGSDFVSESEDEDEIRKCFSQKALKIFDSEKINLNIIINNEQYLKEVEQELYEKYKLSDKISLLEQTLQKIKENKQFKIQLIIHSI